MVASKGIVMLDYIGLGYTAYKCSLKDTISTSSTSSAPTPHVWGGGTSSPSAMASPQASRRGLGRDDGIIYVNNGQGG